MTEKQTIVLISLLVILCVINLLATIKAVRYFNDDKKRKRLNTVLIWTLPLFWSFIILVLTSKVKNKRRDGYKYHESGYGPYTKYGG